MSYILDALKKAEHEREIGQVPGIGSAHETAFVAGAGRWVWILLVVLLVNAALLAFTLWPESGSRSRPVPVADPTESTARPQGSLPLPAGPAPDSEIVHPPAQPMVSREMPAVVAPPPAGLTPLRPLPPLSEPPQPDVVGTTGFADTFVSRPGEVKAAPPPVAAAVNSGDDNLPVWPQVSDQLLREINSALHLDVHVYSDEQHERFVLINMRKYKEGEQLQEGPVVDAITPEGVILSFRGQRFRMQSQ